MKQFRKKAEEIRPLARGFGARIASGGIPVDGQRVGWMYREETDEPADGGWRFFAGDESEAYMADSGNHGVYDCNTIANYDPDIIPLLASPIGSAFERDASGRFVRVR
jgi:hypothetical protein